MYFGFEHLTVGYGGNTVLRDLSLEIPQGRIVTLIGPNGCGKSTLLKTVSGVLRPRDGRVVLENRQLTSYSPRERARRIAYLAQSLPILHDIDVRTLVSYGRYPYRRFGQGMTASDISVIDRALAVTGLTAHRHRMLTTLSGGELQRARLAMSIAQQPQILLLDEPTTHLDIGYQIEVLELVRSLNRSSGLTVFMVLHDLNLAARYSDLLCVLHDGAIYAAGSPEEVMISPILREVFGIDAEIMRDEKNGCPHLIPQTYRKEEDI